MPGRLGTERPAFVGQEHRMSNIKEGQLEIGLRPMISIAELLQRIPICRSTLDKLVKEGAFPKPCYLTPMKLGFFVDEVIQWQEGLVRGTATTHPTREASSRS
jgi:predicted DNA-binding transcriptional regulator AlpA